MWELSHYLLIIGCCSFYYESDQINHWIWRRASKTRIGSFTKRSKNEFKELSDSLNISPTTSDWEIIILKFCLDFEDCFKTWTDNKEPEHNQIHKCMTMMRVISKNKKSVTEITHIENIAYNISKEFQEVYKRLRWFMI